MRGLVAVLLTVGTQAAAFEMACTFRLECLEGESCEMTEFSVSLNMLAPPTIDEMTQDSTVARYDATMMSDAVTIEGVFMAPDPAVDNTAVFTSFPGRVTHTLSISSDLRARYVVILAEDDFLVSYRAGTCEGQPE